VAYGARLESVLGATPQEFESLILRQLDQEDGVGRHRLGLCLFPSVLRTLGPLRAPDANRGRGRAGRIRSRLPHRGAYGPRPATGPAGRGLQ
jgi:hypothetical protein